ncbi:hypothetical protein EIN_085050 [Entamoeba invadens IP1]|uniref:hypothetical protein n=1 Tax=Entamoeba invadens IP1 TaxID=370355 RepID=UPI0002C3F7BB|nr:hypothetical protein EIN_085050 [Entamoeba invadens IP1]ELP85293.1 hypothetical protein EIN_085050 [Entamoeba invadens IP1]|eukprot:XP_004184639.1 hypothetical protein EIN_085050 [Entamoeba invadens IP1]
MSNVFVDLRYIQKESEMVQKKLDELSKLKTETLEIPILHASDSVEKSLQNFKEVSDNRFGVILKFNQLKEELSRLLENFENLTDDLNNEQLDLVQTINSLKQKSLSATSGKGFTHPLLSFDDIKKIEEWTNLKMAHVVFDSSTDSFSMCDSVFANKIENKKNLVFLIQDTTGFVFGGFVGKEIVKKESQTIEDENCFVFVTESHGLLKSQMKFKIKEEHKGIAFLWYFLDNDQEGLFGFADDIMIYKDGIKESRFNLSCFEYGDKTEDLLKMRTSIDPFVPLQLVVIQLL